jgi:hypothetical protein
MPEEREAGGKEREEGRNYYLRCITTQQSRDSLAKKLPRSQRERKEGKLDQVQGGRSWRRERQRGKPDKLNA